MDSLGQIQTFLETLFPDLQNQWLLIWALPSKTSYWAQEINTELCKTILKWSESEDIYVGCGLRDRNYGPKVRGDYHQVSGIVGVWLDVDYGRSHKKRGLPPVPEAAMGLIQEMGLQPSVVVNSGHGYHAWWKFTEPWIFENDQDRDKAAQLSRAWNKTFGIKAKAKGYSADSVGDLARVLRIPGTWNRKGVEIPCTLSDFNQLTYDPIAFPDYLASEAETPDPVSNLDWEFDIIETADPPAEKFHLLCHNEEKFKDTFNHTRSLESPSEYDLSLATYAMAVGWTPQEIVNLLVAHRRKHGIEIKQHRRYYELTLNKASQSKVVEDQQRLAEAFANGEDLPPDAKKDPAEIKAILSKLLDFQFGKIIKYVQHPDSEYKIQINGHLHDMGGIGCIISQHLFRLRIADSPAGKNIPRFKGKDWDRIAQLMLDIREEVETGKESQGVEGTKLRLDSYLLDHGVDAEDWQESMIRKVPFFHDGSVYITSSGFIRYLQGAYNERVTAQQLGVKLTAIGAKMEVKAVNTKRFHTSRACWRLPAWVTKDSYCPSENLDDF